MDDAFSHDVPEDVKGRDERSRRSRGPRRGAMAAGEMARRATRFVQSRNDRLFPLEFQRRVVRERLGSNWTRSRPMTASR